MTGLPTALSELEAPPPRASGPLVRRTLRRHRLRVLAPLGVPVFLALVFVAANLYQQRQGLVPWPWSRLGWFAAAGVALALPLWLYGRRGAGVIRRVLRDGQLLPATARRVRGDRFAGVEARFSAGGATFALVVGRGASRVGDGDACAVLFVPATGEAAVVLPDAGVVVDVDGPCVATRV